MSGSEHTDRENLYMNGDGPAGFTGFSDAQSGEYRYKSGYTQRIYSDAHYVPADENTVPPRYYTPPEESAKHSSGYERRQRSADSSRHTRQTKRGNGKDGRRSGGRGLAILLMCLICFVTGAGAGAFIVGSRAESRLESMEQRLAEAEDDIKEASSLSRVAVKATSNLAERIPTPSKELTPSEIYSLACKQVVKISVESESTTSTGSGFIVSEDGYILTNYHVISDAYEEEIQGAQVTVKLHDGREFRGLLSCKDKNEDVALLRIEASGFTPATFGNSDDLSVGDEVYVIGNPHGLEFSMTSGKVSALDRSVTSDVSISRINMFQIDAAVNSGNSGGPVYNSRGEVVGIVTAKYADSEGLAFAVPIDEATTVIGPVTGVSFKYANEVQTTEKAYLGVSVDTRFSPVYSRYYGIPMGAYVSAVFQGSCAERAGVQVGDIITAVGDTTVTSSSDLTETIESFAPGDRTSITVYRSGSEIKLEIVLDKAE